MVDPMTPADQTSEAEFGCWEVSSDRGTARFKISPGLPPADESVFTWSEPLLRALEQRPVVTSRRSWKRSLLDFEIKKSIGRYRQLERLTQNQAGSSPDAEIRESILNCIRVGRGVLHSRYMRQRVFDRVGELLAWGLGTWAGAYDAVRELSVADPGVSIYILCGVLVYILGRALRATFEPRFRLHRPVGLSFILGSIVFAIYAYTQRKGHADIINGIQLGSVLGTFYAAIILIAIVTWIRPITMHLPYPGLPIETLCVLLIDAAIATRQASDDHGKMREALFAIDQAADAAESSFRRLAPVDDRELRAWTVDVGRRVATTIRKHKRLIVDPNFEKVNVAARSLTNGVIHLARGDWSTLMATEPEAPRPVPLWRRLLPRFLLAGFLVVSALLLPKLFPQLVPAPQVATLRIYFFGLAIASLISPDVGKVRDAVLQVLRRN